jgi:signal transduction histidine kinase
MVFLDRSKWLYAATGKEGEMEPVSKVNVLIVDDQASNLLALEAILAGKGLNLVRARSGEEALLRVLDHDFAVILLDVQMPEMGGFEAAALIRERDRSKQTPIIFLTAFQSSEGQIFQGYALGAVDYLSKPIVPAVLRSKVGVFVELFEKTEQVKRQAAELHETQCREHERALLEQKRQWELERLRAEAAREKSIAEEQARRAQELARNVAERIRAEEQLREADRRKDEFLAMLAHELRNPMAPILNALRLLREQDAGATVEDARNVAERQVRHLARLVDDLLDVSRISSGKIQLRTSRLELGRSVARAVESVRSTIVHRGQELSVSLPDEPILLEADEARLEQVLSNLLNNAAKYTEPAGRIAIEAGRDREWAVVRVRDNGIGIAPELLPHVFDLFRQADRSLDRSQGGLGIGLTLVRRLVELHGGNVSASSDGVGRGSEFVIRLPVCVPVPTGERPSASPPISEAGTPPAEERSKRVLVVEDNRDGARLMARLLEGRGHQTQVANDGPAALDLARTERPDVILLDIGLPGMDGYQVAEQVRGIDGMERTLILALTGYGQEADRQRSHDAGIDLHMVKPVDPDLLFQLVASERPIGNDQQSSARGPAG